MIFLSTFNILALGLFLLLIISLPACSIGTGLSPQLIGGNLGLQGTDMEVTAQQDAIVSIDSEGLVNILFQPLNLGSVVPPQKEWIPVRIESLPSHLELTVNGSVVGITPFVHKLPVGEYNLYLKQNQEYVKYFLSVSCCEEIRATINVAHILSTMKHEPLSGIDFTYVPAGVFMMGDLFGIGEEDELPSREQTVKPFYISTHEISQEQWRRITGTSPSFTVGSDHPVENISWQEANTFAMQLTTLTGRSFSLPDEIQWEYAARSGGLQQQWPGEEILENLTDSCTFDGETKGASHQPIGGKKPNGLGIFDMCGNVSEWTSSPYSLYPNVETDNTKMILERVVRGGAWDEPAVAQRSSRRNFQAVNHRDVGIGIRLVSPAEIPD